MKATKWAAWAVCLLLLPLGTLAGCRHSSETSDTDASSRPQETIGESAEEATLVNDPSTDPAESDTADTPTIPAEPTTDAAYPDGEENPDWPYSPGV